MEQVRSTLRERIARGATLNELETLLRMTRGLTERQRDALLNEAWRHDPRRMTFRRVDAAREWLGRFTPSRNGRSNGSGRSNCNGRSNGNRRSNGSGTRRRFARSSAVHANGNGRRPARRARV